MVRFGNADHEPSVDVPQVVRDLWADIFQLEEIHPDDHFIDLGGDSLTAKRLLASIEDRLGCRLPFRTVIEAGTLSSFTARVQEQCARD